jgi:HD-GYP domain-containing protein (c-di-GMP phosphodiesterase class II)
MQTGPLVAELPSGKARECESVREFTRKDSLPETTRAPPLRLQPPVPLYIGALAAQFCLDFASSASRERLALGISPLRLLRFIGSAWLVDLALAPIGLSVGFVAWRSPYGTLLTLPLVGLLAVFARERQSRIDHVLELGHAYRGTALLLGDVVEADDAYTGSHSREVVDLVLAVCDELGLSPRERRDAEFAALLHDVGKIRHPPRRSSASPVR